MNEYYFLFLLALIWIIMAVIQDIRRTEIPDWLNFSLAIFALAYRAFYSIQESLYSYFVYGLVGFFIFYLVGTLFYYGRIFGGGDAKLLAAIGAVLPYESMQGLFLTLLVFLLALFLSGLVYTAIYSILIACRQSKRFLYAFKFYLRSYFTWFFACNIAFCLILSAFIGGYYSLYFFITCEALFFIFSYFKAVDDCMIVLKKPQDLMEGDSLVESVKIGRKTISQTVYGLTKNDIKLLRKKNRRVLIKEGVPYTPAFILGFVIMVSFYLSLGSLSLDFF